MLYALILTRENFHYQFYLPKCNKPAGKFSVADIPETRVTHTVVYVCIHMQTCQGTLLVHIVISVSAAVFTVYLKRSLGNHVHNRLKSYLGRIHGN